VQTLVERGCGMDVHQATVVACCWLFLKDGKSKSRYARLARRRESC